MSNIIMCLSLALSSFYLFSLSYRIISVNRAFTNIPLSVIETSIPLVQNNNDFRPYFDKKKLVFNLTYYFENSIKPYSKSYKFQIYYYNQDNYTYCKSNYCSAFEITIDVKFDLFNKYHKVSRFFIEHNG